MNNAVICIQAFVKIYIFISFVKIPTSRIARPYGKGMAIYNTLPSKVELPFCIPK